MPKLIKYIEQSTGYNSAIITSVTAAFYKFIEISLRQGEEIKIENFGNFSAKDMEERPGRNPRTGEQITIAAKRKPLFKFSRSFLDLVQPTGDDDDDDTSVPANTPAIPSVPTPAPTSTPVPGLAPSPVVTTPEPLPTTVIPPLMSASAIPPIPESLVKPPADKVWYMSGADNSSFVEVRQSELSTKGLVPQSPLWSQETGWVLAQSIPELSYLFANSASN